MKRNTCLMLVLLLGTPFLSLSQELDKMIYPKIDSIFQEFNNPETPGLSVVFLKDGKPLYSKSYGMADLEHQIPLSDSSVFSLASVSKQFTAFALLLLEEEGQLSLDDDIRKYLPSFPDYGQVISIRMLAQHTSGIRSCLQLLGQKGYTPDHVITMRDVQKIIYRQKQLNFPPGTAFGYSNSGYVLLADIVEKASGISFPQFVQERILNPLGMKASFVMQDYHRVIKNRARSYEWNGDAYVNAPANYAYYGPTNLYTTPADLIKWALNFETIKVGSPQIMEKMNQLGQLNNGQKTNYALGQLKGTFKGQDYFFHSGADAGYRTFLGRFPEEKAAVILLSNNGRIYAQGKAREVADLFLKDDPGKSQKNDPPKQASEIISLSQDQLKQYEGYYLNKSNYIIRHLFLKNDTLTYSRPEQANRATPLLPLSIHLFQLGLVNDIQVKFEGGVPGKMRILENNEEVEFYQKYKPIKYKPSELKTFEGEYYSEELDIRYKLFVLENQLLVQHSKIGSIPLEALIEDTFLSPAWQFRSLVFERDQEDKIKGFRISTDRAQNVTFKRIAPLP